ncbi:unnamed protein product [Trifolium pratense]|uniref:Uncharacterized protein n=1 Tax=Trifolium pratense TaxID=57577 RepID=A0ACB0M7W0_TRIPR|nr:unnamed protein product [Trifolium pratense]
MQASSVPPHSNKASPHVDEQVKTPGQASSLHTNLRDSFVSPSLLTNPAARKL